MKRRKESEEARLLRKQLEYMDFLDFIKGKRTPPLEARQKFNNLLVRMYEEDRIPNLEDFPTKMITVKQKRYYKMEKSKELNQAQYEKKLINLLIQFLLVTTEEYVSKSQRVLNWYVVEASKCDESSPIQYLKSRLERAISSYKVDNNYAQYLLKQVEKLKLIEEKRPEHFDMFDILEAFNRPHNAEEAAKAEKYISDLFDEKTKDTHEEAERRMKELGISPKPVNSGVAEQFGKSFGSSMTVWNYNEANMEQSSEFGTAVNHPFHYQGSIECIDAIHSAFDDDGVLSFCKGNAMKYLWRAGRKEGNTQKQDLEKAIWYLQYALKTLEGTTDAQGYGKV